MAGGGEVEEVAEDGEDDGRREVKAKVMASDRNSVVRSRKKSRSMGWCMTVSADTALAMNCWFRNVPIGRVFKRCLVFGSDHRHGFASFRLGRSVGLCMTVSGLTRSQSPAAATALAINCWFQSVPIDRVIKRCLVFGSGHRDGFVLAW